MSFGVVNGRPGKASLPSNTCCSNMRGKNNFHSGLRALKCKQDDHNEKSEEGVCKDPVILMELFIWRDWNCLVDQNVYTTLGLQLGCFYSQGLAPVSTILPAISTWHDFFSSLPLRDFATSTQTRKILPGSPSEAFHTFCPSLLETQTFALVSSI